MRLESLHLRSRMSTSWRSVHCPSLSGLKVHNAFASKPDSEGQWTLLQLVLILLLRCKVPLPSACLCLLLLAQCTGQPIYFSISAAVKSIHQVFCRALVCFAKCEVPQVESSRQDGCCFGGKTVCEGYSTLLRKLCACCYAEHNLCLDSSAVVACLAVCRCLFPGIVISEAKASVTS